MNVIDEIVQKRGKGLFILIDPGKQTNEVAAERAKTCEEYGADAIMVGGTTNDNPVEVDATIKAIKDTVDIPIIQFPNSASVVSLNAQHIFSMVLLNSNDIRIIIKQHLNGVKRLRGGIQKGCLNPIPLCYLVVSMGKKTQIEKKYQLDVLTGEDIEKTVDYAWVAENLWGMSCIYLEAGSGSEKPVPDEMINAVKDNIHVPLIVGGGITDAQTAKNKVDAGADVIVVGTLVEEKGCDEVKKISKAIR
jgi:phosphoglycerol geranylgeranyltransferase